MKSYRELNIYNDSKRFAVEVHEDLRSKYDQFSKRINKFAQTVEENWNEFPTPETVNM